MPSLISLVVFVSSLVGLGAGQTARINLTYATAATQTAPALSRPEPPSVCRVQVKFFDARSHLVQSQTVSLAPGQSTQVSLTRNQLASPLANHPLFWAEAGLVDNCNNNPNCDVTLCTIGATGEETDSSNSTDLVIDNLTRSARLAAAPN